MQAIVRRIMYTMGRIMYINSRIIGSSRFDDLVFPHTRGVESGAYKYS